MSQNHDEIDSELDELDAAAAALRQQTLADLRADYERAYEYLKKWMYDHSKEGAIAFSNAIQFFKRAKEKYIAQEQLIASWSEGDHPDD